MAEPRTLILGGAGFLGYHLARHLAQAGRGGAIVLADNLSRGARDRDLETLLGSYPSVTLRHMDLRRPDAFAELDGRFDAVYLFAAVVGVRHVEADPAAVIHTNTTIVLNALEWLKLRGCARACFASTSEVYAGSVELGLAPVPTPETAPAAIADIRHPRFSYAVTKLLGEAAVSHYARQAGFDAVIIRYHNVYGPRMGRDHVIPELMERIAGRVDPFPVYGLAQTRAFCYVSDAVEATVALMGAPQAAGRIVHVGDSREETSIRELAQRLFDLTGFHPVIAPRPAPSGAVSRRCPDTALLRELTGFAPRVGLGEGLARTWAWYRERLPGGAHPSAPALVGGGAR